MTLAQPNQVKLSQNPLNFNNINSVEQHFTDSPFALVFISLELVHKSGQVIVESGPCRTVHGEPI